MNDLITLPTIQTYSPNIPLWNDWLPFFIGMGVGMVAGIIGTVSFLGLI